MSSSIYESQVRQHERALERHRKAVADAVKTAAKIEREIVNLEKQAQTTRSDSSRRSYLSRADGKRNELLRARDKEAKASADVASEQTKLSSAQQRLAEARLREQRQADEKARRQAQQREAREQAERIRRESQERAHQRAQAQREADRDRELEGLHHRTTVLERQLAEAERRAAPREVTVLFLASNPVDQTALRLDQETRAIQKQVRAADYRDSIWFEWRLARQVTDLIQDLNEVKPGIVHFSGHGSDAELVFENEDGMTQPLASEQLLRVLATAPKRIRLVVFNSCDSAAHARLATDVVDVAIGMDASIGDDTAKTFAAQFYSSLGFGLSVGEAYRQAVLQVELQHARDHHVPKLFAKDGVEAETVVLVNPADEEASDSRATP